MIDLNFIRQFPDLFDQGLAKRFMEPCADSIIKLDAKIRDCKNRLQQLQSEKNRIADEIGKFKQQGTQNPSQLETLLQEAETVKKAIPSLEHESKVLEQNLKDKLDTIPNLPAEDVPVGQDESGNTVISTYGTPRTFAFTPKHHFELGDELGQMDFAKTAQISGSRFVTLSGQLALLERALSQFMLDMHTREFGYTEVSPPSLVFDSAMYGVGQLPKFAHDSFTVSHGYRLITTSEAFLTNLVADEIIDSDKLPLRYTAATPCFRSEAGSAGRDTRGMIRLHQFLKVELVSITMPEDSEKEHHRMLEAAETILRRLELPYRVSLLCSGDMGFQSQKTYDIEVWLPAQGSYREISSCSNCSDFQARRMKSRYRHNKQKGYVHTLNASGLAVGRTIVAIMENYQQEDGSIAVPTVLQNYMSGLKKIVKQQAII